MCSLCVCVSQALVKSTCIITPKQIKVNKLAARAHILIVAKINTVACAIHAE